MSRARRLQTLVRVRDLQERVAEADASARRRAADERREQVQRARRSLDRAGSSGGVLTAADLAHRQTVIECGVYDVERRSEALDLATEAHADARHAWQQAHLRHDAIQRVHERVTAEETADEMRRTQLELDELVTTRHPRRTQEHR